MEIHCYCGNAEPERRPYMLICDGCKKYFHAGCLDTAKLSPLSGDIFYQFKCRQCGDEGKEEFERMKMQWVQVVMLTLYNLQLGGSGKCGYFRWKEHICAFIDKHWNHLFSSHRKKTSLWHGTVAGTLSTGCPGYFTSGANVLGEAGWWKLTEMKPPTLKMESGLKLSRKKNEAASDPTASMKVEGLRSRQGRSSIEAAIALKAKRSTLTEAKEMRKARALNRTPESTPTKTPFPGPSETASTSETSLLPKVENFELFQSETSVSDSSSSSKISDQGKKRKKNLQESSFKSIKLEPQDDLPTQADEPNLSISLKQEPPDSEDSLASAALQSLHQRLEMDSDSQFSLSSSHVWFTDKDTKPSDTMPEMFLHNDSDSDLEIDPGTMSPPAGMASASFRESPTLQDILSTMDDNSRMSEVSQGGSIDSKPASVTIKSEPVSPAEFESEAEEEKDVKEEVKEEGEESDSSSEEEEEPSGRRRKVEEERGQQEEEPPQPRLTLMSVYEEHQLLRKLNMTADKVTLDPELNRLRRKLIVRQLKRERGMAVFDIDMEMKKYVKFSGELNKLQEVGGQCYSFSTQMKHNRSDLRILDRFQCNRSDRSRNMQQFSSFLNRLVGTEDDQLQSITSPYTTRVLKPFIRRDFESKPIKMKLMEEIVAYQHRNDKTWRAPPSPPIDYCYVRPQHIPSVNHLCREFFWPGIDLSECLQYPDFSCVVLYRKVVIGFAFMVPDVKYNEAYISFIFTHPEWRRAGIATFMLYHLIQTCMGKDVTLHVSATNSAMLLYQKFGFKTEEMILDFYDKYYPVDSHECKHAFFLRLRR